MNLHPGNVGWELRHDPNIAALDVSEKELNTTGHRARGGDFQIREELTNVFGQEEVRFRSATVVRR